MPKLNTRAVHARSVVYKVALGVYRVLVGRPEGKRPLGRPRHRWENNIKMDLREIGIDGTTGFG